MYHQKHFLFLFFIFIQSSEIAYGMYCEDRKLQLPGCISSKKDIINDPKPNSSRKFHCPDCQGNYIVSNCPLNSVKVLTCYAGKINHAPEKTNVIYNQLAILNLEIGINQPFRQIPEFNNTIPVSAIHLLDCNTPIVSHNKKIYLLKEVWDWKNIFNWFKLPILSGAILEYTLQIQLDLTPALNNDDTIEMIDSCDSHLVAISADGHISTWKKNKSEIDATSFKTTQSPSKNFSSAINHQYKLICLGLENGNVFTASIDDLTRSKTISLFPNTNARINWINSYAGTLLCASLHNCYKEKFSKHDCNKHEVRGDHHKHDENLLEIPHSLVSAQELLDILNSNDKKDITTKNCLPIKKLQEYMERLSSDKWDGDVPTIYIKKIILLNDLEMATIIQLQYMENTQNHAVLQGTDNLFVMPINSNLDEVQLSGRYFFNCYDPYDHCSPVRVIDTDKTLTTINEHRTSDAHFLHTIQQCIPEKNKRYHKDKWADLRRILFITQPLGWFIFFLTLKTIYDFSVV